MQKPTRFDKVRRDHATETAEDYVEAISDIVHGAGECRVKDLAGSTAPSRHPTSAPVQQFCLLRSVFGPGAYTPNLDLDVAAAACR